MQAALSVTAEEARTLVAACPKLVRTNLNAPRAARKLAWWRGGGPPPPARPAGGARGAQVGPALWEGCRVLGQPGNRVIVAAFCVHHDGVAEGNLVSNRASFRVLLVVINTTAEFRSVPQGKQMHHLPLVVLGGLAKHAKLA